MVTKKTLIGFMALCFASVSTSIIGTVTDNMPTLLVGWVLCLLAVSVVFAWWLRTVCKVLHNRSAWAQMRAEVDDVQRECEQRERGRL